MQKRQFLTVVIAILFSALCWKYPYIWSNSLFVLWLSVVFHRRFRYTLPEETSAKIKVLSTGASYLSIIISLFLLIKQFKRLVFENSAVLDFENILNINKDSLESIISTLLMTLACFLFSHRMMLGIFQMNLPRNWRVLTLLGVLVLTLPLAILFNLPMNPFQAALIPFVYLLFFDLYIENHTSSLTWLISWLVIFSVFNAMFLYKYNLEYDLKIRLDHAKVLSDLRDEEAEEELAPILKSVLADDSLQVFFTTPIPFTFSKKAIRKRMDVFFIGTDYLSQVYDYDIFVLNENFGHTFVEKQINSFSLLRTLPKDKLNQLLFTPGKYSNYIYSWQTQIPIPGDTSAFNTVVLGVKPKIITNVLPINYKHLNDLQLYNFAVYYNNDFVWKQGEILLDEGKTIIPAANHSQEVFSGATSNLIYSATNNTTVIISREVGGYYRPMTFFSFIFSLFIFAIIFLSILNYFFKALSLAQEFPLFWGPSLRNKIQLYIIILLLASFFAMGMVSNVSFRKTFAGNTTLPTQKNAAKYDTALLRFWENLLNVYVFLLLITAALSILITNRITDPLSQMMEKLKGTKLGKNEPLEWNSDDEIGELVNTYNNMIAKLEESATKLKQSEREGAWREMAKQVAHEIKNPLTPMKLHVQHLMRVADADPEQVKPLVKRVAQTLIEQIDSLTRIATEFSSFAQMPATQNTNFSLKELLKGVCQLFEKGGDNTHIELIISSDKFTVFADREQLLRVFNNLLKNAIQSIPDDRKGKIKISLKRDKNTAIIAIEDNGTGIPAAMQSRVFEPSFTTKNSGMGLGLAISKNIIESAGGKIYFETNEGVRTVFFVEMPIYKNPRHF